MKNKALGKSYQKEDLKQSTNGITLFEQKRLKIIENLKEFRIGVHHKSQGERSLQPKFYDTANYCTQKSRSDEKCGYLMKRALHTRMGKHWLKRKCSAENGLFYIYHSEVIRCSFLTFKRYELINCL